MAGRPPWPPGAADRAEGVARSRLRPRDRADRLHRSGRSRPQPDHRPQDPPGQAHGVPPLPVSELYRRDLHPRPLGRHHEEGRCLDAAADDRLLPGPRQPARLRQPGQRHPPHPAYAGAGAGAGVHHVRVLGEGRLRPVAAAGKARVEGAEADRSDAGRSRRRAVLHAAHDTAGRAPAGGVVDGYGAGARQPLRPAVGRPDRPGGVGLDRPHPDLRGGQRLPDREPRRGPARERLRALRAAAHAAPEA